MRINLLRAPFRWYICLLYTSQHKFVGDASAHHTGIGFDRHHLRYARAGKNAVVGFIAVSYTHLDVYKRQDYKVKINAALCFANKKQTKEYYHNSSFLEHGLSLIHILCETTNPLCD